MNKIITTRPDLQCCAFCAEPNASKQFPGTAIFVCNEICQHNYWQRLSTATQQAISQKFLDIQRDVPMDSTLINGVVSTKNLKTAKKVVKTGHQLVHIVGILTNVFKVVGEITEKKKYNTPLDSRDLDKLIKALEPLKSFIPK